MTKGIYVNQLKAHEVQSGLFFLKYITLMEAKDGRKYINFIASDQTGDIECRIWQNAEEIASSFKKGNYIRLQGKTNYFQGKKQFIVTKIEGVSSNEVNQEDFILKSRVSPDQMLKELIEILDQNLTDVYIKELLELIIHDSEIQRRLKKWPAGKSIHHAYQGGLLEHILSCAKLAAILSPIYQVNVNYVIAGAIIHDLCKIYELSDGPGVDYTEEGKLVGHLVKGLEVIDRYSYRIKNFPYDLKLHLKHIALSHHGKYEFGSPKIPQTKEAMLVHMIDLMDSKMSALDTIIKSDQNYGHWSNFVKHLDCIVYKSELPFYPEHLEDSAFDKKGQSGKWDKKNVKHEKKASAGAKNRDRPITQSMSGLLKGVKLD